MHPEIRIDDDFTQDVFAYLDALREGGTINMMQAPGVLQEAYGFDSTVARTFFTLWTETK